MSWSRPLAVGVFAAALSAPLVTRPLAAQGQSYGSVVAAGSDAIFVGQPSNQYAPGSVYLYRLVGGKWQPAKELTAGDTPNDGFGSALAWQNGTLLVGASRAEGEKGAAYLYTGDKAGNWKQAAKLTAADGARGDEFGGAVALAGDYIAVAAAARDSSRGQVYLFHKTGSGWAQDTTLLPLDVDRKEEFGSALAFAGNRLFVGAARKDSLTGAVYVFSRDAKGAWTQETKLRGRGLDKRANFGAVLALDGHDVLVGAPGAYAAAGAVFVFRWDTAGSRWSEAGRLLPFDAAFARFGSAIAVAGNTLWVGAPASDRFEGRVYRLTRDTSGAWTAASKFGAAQAGQRTQLGGALAVAGNLAVVGVPGADFGAGKALLMTNGAKAGWSVDKTVMGEDKGLAAMTGGKIDCSNNKVKIFDCQEVDLLSFLPLKEIGAGRGVVINDIWGWTDAQTGKEYALVGRINGTSFVDISDPAHPRYLGDLPMTKTAHPAVWRDIKVYKNHAYIVADGAGDHGMQVFDLTKLRTVSKPQTFTEAAHYDKIHSAHNIVIDTASGFAFTVGNSSGGETCGGGLHMIDIRNPEQPTFAGCFADPATGRAGTGYIHDAQCVTYHGPDQAFQGKEICFNAAETALSIADVTDKKNPVALAHAAYPNVGYAHQGWLDEQQKYFYMNDELDEIEGKTDGTRTLIWDVTNLKDPVLVGAYVSKVKATDHNLYVKGDLMYESNYVSGLRVIDISDRKNPKEVAYFDTVPVGTNDPGFGGSWSNYPFFKSGTVIVTSMNEGLFMLKKHQQPMTP